MARRGIGDTSLARGTRARRRAWHIRRPCNTCAFTQVQHALCRCSSGAMGPRRYGGERFGPCVCVAVPWRAAATRTAYFSSVDRRSRGGSQLPWCPATEGVAGVASRTESPDPWEGDDTGWDTRSAYSWAAEARPRTRARSVWNAGGRSAADDALQRLLRRLHLESLKGRGLRSGSVSPCQWGHGAMDAGPTQAEGVHPVQVRTWRRVRCRPFPAETPSKYFLRLDAHLYILTTSCSLTGVLDLKRTTAAAPGDRSEQPHLTGLRRPSRFYSSCGELLELDSARSNGVLRSSTTLSGNIR